MLDDQGKKIFVITSNRAQKGTKAPQAAGVIHTDFVSKNY